ncbi:MAG: histidine phosphatase family protein [Alphaproteobacteria bacterium]|nr:histidine phosphatase family protein [Alphaproteobacteria bacterium]MBO6628154.1 histidine phosphatase family protein [Alphaproteobacteria bacterium]MDF1625159.1 phosphoglycerate mutase family protein [Parvibaculaceae bacterium]
MPRIYMIRHGEAAAGWDADKDPGLSDLGWQQAEQAARNIMAREGRALPVLSSPLRRCRETSEPLSKAWGLQARIEPRVAEIPSPELSLSERGGWLRRIMTGTWAETLSDAANPDLMGWKQAVADALLELDEDTVIFSHFIAINAAVGHALDDPRVICFKPDNCSITIFETSAGQLKLLEQGGEAETKVN